MLLRFLHVLFFSYVMAATAQIDSSNHSLSNRKKNNVKPVSYIIPAAMVVYGFVAVKNKGLININQQLQQIIWDNNPHKRTDVDDFAVFAPAVAVYGLNMVGIKGKHNFTDRTIMYGLSMVLAAAIVIPAKNFTNEIRPDGSNQLSFPSGHTAGAFVAAEFLRQEYKDVSPWYGIAGYAVASTTGYLRMYNNKHWFNDIAGAAGIGILSVQAVYWLYPKLKNKWTKKKETAFFILPYYQQQTGGVVCIYKL